MSSFTPPPAGFAGTLRTDEEACAVYSEAAGIAQIVPAAVGVAASAGDVPLLLHWARHNSLPVTARGSGSSMAGGALGSGLILDLSRLRTLHPVDGDARRVRAEPGVLRDEIDSAAREHGLRFPVDPSSGRFCTIGGMVATNAAGAHSLKYGATRDWVEAIDCVFADGTTTTLRRGEAPPANVPAIERALRALEQCRERAAAFERRVRKDSSGYAVGRWLSSGDLLDLIVGSEGTLAVVTGVELRLEPAASGTTSLLAAFADLDAAADGARRAGTHGAAVCELLDASFLEIASASDSYPKLPAGTTSVLLVELESPPDPSAREVRDDLHAAGATEVVVALVPDAEREIWELRHAASPMLARLDPSLRSVQLIEDAAVPPESLAEYIRLLRAALERRKARAVIFGHAGDAHVHVNPLVDLSVPEWKRHLTDLLEEITSVVAGLHGTLSGEHGDGRLRAPLLHRTWPAEAVEAFAELKNAFDPDGLLNPGVKLPLSGQQPIERVKYDPVLPPLPTAARRALDHVADTRGYALPRLSLLGGGN